MGVPSLLGPKSSNVIEDDITVSKSYTLSDKTLLGAWSTQLLLGPHLVVIKEWAFLVQEHSLRIGRHVLEDKGYLAVL